MSEKPAFGRFAHRRRAPPSVTGSGRGSGEGGVSANVPDKQQQEYQRYCTLSRAGTPAEAAELVTFLASDRSSYINAQAIFVDGGI